jgi:fructose-1,6-bisphosphatase/inositol monophosphatase family enzyme
MGLEYKKRRIAGVVYDPTREEIFSAEQGTGAFLNGQPIHVSKTAKLAGSLLATGFPSNKRHHNPNIHFYHQITLRTHGVRRAGSAALDLCYVAQGALTLLGVQPKSLGHCRRRMMVEEAGDRVSGLSRRLLSDRWSWRDHGVEWFDPRSHDAGVRGDFAGSRLPAVA